MTKNFGTVRQGYFDTPWTVFWVDLTVIRNSVRITFSCTRGRIIVDVCRYIFKENYRYCKMDTNVALCLVSVSKLDSSKDLLRNLYQMNLETRTKLFISFVSSFDQSYLIDMPYPQYMLKRSYVHESVINSSIKLVFIPLQLV